MAFRSVFIETRHQDVQIHVSLAEGPAASSDATPTIVFLHYWGGSTRTWEQMASRVAAAGCRTASIDFRGWGRSTGPAAPGAYTISLLADDVLDALVRLPLRSVVLVGLSWAPTSHWSPRPGWRRTPGPGPL